MIQNPILWELGTIDLALPSRASTDYKIYTRALLHDSDTAMHALPEIEHVARTPAPRPSSALSTLFTVLTLAPALILVFGLGAVGA